MTFEEFKTYVKNNIQKYMPEKYKDYESVCYENYKNGKKLTGLGLHAPISTVGSAPLIYLEPAYIIMQEQTVPVDLIVQALAKQYTGFLEKYTLPHTEFYKYMTDYEAAKDRIFPHIQNSEANKNKIKDFIKKEIADFSVTYYIYGDASENGEVMMMPVHKEILKNYGISQEELHAQAIKNMLRKFPSKINEFSDSFDDMPGIPALVEEQAYTLKNDNSPMGSTALLDTELLDRAYQAFGPYQIVALFTNEVMLMPLRSVEPNTYGVKRDLKMMGEEMYGYPNFLSTEILTYNPKTKELEVVEEEKKDLSDDDIREDDE